MTGGLREPTVNAVCHVCGQRGLTGFPAFPDLVRVTSDCRPWPGGGSLALCPRCSTVQKVVDEAYRRECRAIYRDYALYFQGQGGEQRLFDQTTGGSRPRSHLLADWLFERASDLPQTARVLDAGCGRGDFLARLAALRPGFELHGLESNPAYREPVEALGAGFHASFDELDGRKDFDLVSLVHALEHIPDPGGFLERAAGLLAPGGRVFVDVPNHLDNPFDLIIADHCTHFCSRTLALALRRAGLAPLALDGERLPKEWLALAASAPGREFDRAWPHPDAVRWSRREVGAALDWLSALAGKARRLVGGGFGIFGTAIAGVWLFGMLDGRAEFFVDEDPGRTGTFMGRPVLAPAEVPEGATVFVPMPRAIAERIAARLGGRGPAYAVPDA